MYISHDESSFHMRCSYRMCICSGDMVQVLTFGGQDDLNRKYSTASILGKHSAILNIRKAEFSYRFTHLCSHIGTMISASKVDLSVGMGLVVRSNNSLA